ncbi:MAG: hypothetical protein N3B01_08655 [Verrucomicrobiae bacterium]|nr:hypothetical protein [Verrucomicrobiae bacterium]
MSWLCEGGGMTWLLCIVLGAWLPSFEDFREADRARRESGRWQSEALARLMQVNPARVLEVARRHSHDWEMQWGAAELVSDWKLKRARFEAAVAGSGTNVAVAARFACAAAAERDDALAMRWIEHCQRHDRTNSVSWLVELWLLRAQGEADRFEPTGAGPVFRDYAEGAARARIRVLEAMGYSKYSARRIGYLPKLYAVEMAQQLRRGKHEPYVREFLLETAAAMQRDAVFLVTELAGQSLETAMLALRPDSPAKQARLEELAERRVWVQEMLGELEQRVDAASEERMVRYFDELLLLGELEAMRRLARELPPPSVTPRRRQ